MHYTAQKSVAVMPFIAESMPFMWHMFNEYTVAMVIVAIVAIPVVVADIAANPVGCPVKGGIDHDRSGHAKHNRRHDRIYTPMGGPRNNWTGS